MSLPPETGTGQRARPRLRGGRGISLRALVPNAVTALALCFGLTAIRFGITEEWDRAILAVMIAAILDGVDGRIARLLKGESRFGAELDSLSDVIAFGVSPTIVIFLWSLQHLPQFGWVFAIAHAVCCALRLARFNASIDAQEQPHKSAGFLTGVPAPAGAAIALVPLYAWLWTGLDLFRQPALTAIWAALVAFLMISSLATFSLSSLRLRSEARLPALVLVALFAVSLITAPWPTLTIAALAYVASIPFSVRRYAAIRRQRGAVRPAGAQPPGRGEPGA